MSRGKKGNSKNAVDSSSGSESFDSVTVNNEQWKCCVVFIAAKSSTDVPYIKALATVATEANQRRFYGLDKEIISQIAQTDVKMMGTSQSGGGGRRSKQTSMPSLVNKYIQVCENICLEGEIPVVSMAKLLKYVVLKRRGQDLSEIEEKIKMSTEDSTTLQGSSNGKGKKTQPTSGRNSKAGKKGKVTPSSGIESVVPLPIKQPTKMSKRGQEEDRGKYSSYERKNGPNCYIFVTGMSADIVKELAAIKLPVHVFANFEVKKNQQKGHVDEIHFDKYWRDVNKAVQDSPNGSDLRNMACIDIQVDLSCADYQRKADEKLFCQEIFDQIIKKVSEVEEAFINYHIYLSHLKMFEVTSVCDNQYEPNVEGIRKEFLSCADVSTLLQAMLTKVENRAIQKSRNVVDPIAVTLQEEAASLPAVEASNIQMACDNTKLNSCCINNSKTECIVNQALYSRILSEVPRCAMDIDELNIDDESLQISRIDMHLYLILLSLEHVRLSTSITPNDVNGLVPQVIGHSIKNMQHASVCHDDSSGEHNSPKRNMTNYSSLQVLTKAGVLESLHYLQETHPYTAVFYHALSRCTVLVAYTGYDDTRMHTFNVSSRCHTNVGFQKYLKYIAKPLCEGVNSPSTEERHCNAHESNKSSCQCSTDEHCFDGPAEMSQTETIVGYNLGDSLLHLQSSHSTFFTSDGVQVNIDKQGFVECSLFISVSLLTPEGDKIGCVKSDRLECALDEQCDKTNDIQIKQPSNGLDHMSLYAFLNNGTKVATSYYGPNGNGCLVNSKVTSLSSSHVMTPQKISKQQDQLQDNSVNLKPTETESAEKEYNNECHIFAYHNKYQHLFATTLYGLKTHIHVYSPLEPNVPSLNEGKKILVKQEYYKTTGRCSEKGAGELYRYYLPDGLLVYILNDQSVIIHCADGSIYRTAMDCERKLYGSQRITQLSGKKTKERSDFERIQSQIRSTSATVGVKEELWVVTLPSGQRYLWNWKDAFETNVPIRLEDVPSFVSTDPVTKQVVTSRADDVVLLFNDDTHTVKFPNGTTFTCTEVGVSDEIIVECPSYATVKYCMNQSKCIIDYKDGVQIECDNCGNYNIYNNSTLNLSLLSQGHALYTPPSGGKYCFDYTGKDFILDATDSSSNIFKVDLHGEAQTSVDNSHSSALHEAFKPRYFIINPDGTGYEIVECNQISKTISLAESELTDIVLHKTVIPDKTYRSTAIIGQTDLGHGQHANNDNVTLHTSRFVSQLCNGQIYFSVPCTDQSDTSLPFSCLQFLTFEPLSLQKRNFINANLKLKRSRHSKCHDLQELWQNSVKTTSDFLIHNSIKKMHHTGSQEKLTNLTNRDMFTRRDTDLEKVLDAIHDHFVPVYFHSDSKYEQSSDQPAMATNSLAPLKLSIHSSQRLSVEHDVYQKCVVVDQPILGSDLLQGSQIVDIDTVISSKHQQQQINDNVQTTQRTFRLSPDKIDFGNVREGCTYTHHVQLCNVGVTSRRFKIKPPSRQSGIKVYYSPGLVAAGLSTSLSVELCPVPSASDEHFICYDVEIHFEGGHLFLPIQANIS